MLGKVQMNFVLLALFLFGSDLWLWLWLWLYSETSELH
jgi:hypothetical protein